METVTICRNNSKRQSLAVSIKSKNILLKEDVLVKVDEYEKKITIARATIDDNKGRRITTKLNSGWFSVFYNGDLPLGRHEVDPEESDIDTLTIYYP